MFWNWLQLPSLVIKTFNLLIFVIWVNLSKILVGVHKELGATINSVILLCSFGSHLNLSSCHWYCKANDPANWFPTISISVNEFKNM